MASILVAYGVALAGLSALVQQIDPVFAKITFASGLVGGGLCVLCGMVGFAGNPRRTWAVLTVVAVLVTLLTQVVQAWVSSAEATSLNMTGRLLLTAMFLMTIGILLYLLHGERPPEFYNPGVNRQETSPGHDDRAQTPDTSRRR